MIYALPNVRCILSHLLLLILTGIPFIKSKIQRQQHKKIRDDSFFSLLVFVLLMERE